MEYQRHDNKASCKILWKFPINNWIISLANDNLANQSTYWWVNIAVMSCQHVNTCGTIIDSYKLVIVYQTFFLLIFTTAWHCKLSCPVNNFRLESSNVQTKEIQSVLKYAIIKWGLVDASTNWNARLKKSFFLNIGCSLSDLTENVCI